MKNKKTYIKSGLLVALLAGTGIAGEVKPLEAKTDSSSLAYLSRQVERVMAKAGISFGGEFRSRGLGTSMSGNLVDSAMSPQKQREDVLFTSLDLEMKVGPHSALQGTAAIRLHEDWRNMFASTATPLTVRWLSVDGNVKDVFFYNAGDFKQKYTELTLWAPEPEIMFEPYIFARQRQQVMNEVFAGDNNRTLQGANLAFMAQMKPAFNEFSAKAYATRLRRQGKEDENPGRPEDTDSKGVLMDRYSTGGNIFMEIRKDLEFGVSGIYTTDAENTYIDTVKNGEKLFGDKTIVFAANGAFGTGLFSAIDTNKINVRLDAEIAMSIYKSSENIIDTSDGGTVFDTTLLSSDRNGMAFNANLGTKVGLGDIGKLKLDLGYIYNDHKFVNEMAQSPVFFNRQIMNTTVKGGYNSFDGLYKSVFKYTPAENEFTVKEPMNKIAWTRGVLTKDELDALVSSSDVEVVLKDEAGNVIDTVTRNHVVANDISGMHIDRVFLDETFSPVMPLGKGTANRAGIDVGFGGEFLNKAILFDSKFMMINTPQNGDTLSQNYGKKFDYLQYGGGTSFDIAQFGNWWQFPFVISGSYSHTNKKTKSIFDGDDLKLENNVDFINASLYWKFWKRAALMGGFQSIIHEAREDGALAAKLTEMNIAGGLEYKVTDGGTLTGTVGNISSKHKDAEYADFSTMQFDLFLTVVF